MKIESRAKRIIVVTITAPHMKSYHDVKKLYWEENPARQDFIYQFAFKQNFEVFEWKVEVR